jgi:thiamine transport system ATP-binding protein
MPATGLDVRDVTVRFDGRTVLDGRSLRVVHGTTCALLGPSGSGKSTLLRVVAGLLVPDAGRVVIDGDDVTNVPTHRRGVGMVFQDDVLFPHLDVGDNVAYGLRAHRVPKPGRRARVAGLLALVGLAGFERRSVTTLSGGEAQRVALARALAPQPRVLLLDEPFGALDRDLHDRLVADVRGLLHDQHVTAVHVTHDPDEAAAIADAVVRL